MKNNQTQYQAKIKNGWKFAAIILIILTVILSGTTTWSIIQINEKDNETVQAEKSTGNDSSEESKTEDHNDASDIEIATRYLTVTEWGVRFPIPDAFSELEYSITTNNRLDFSGHLPSVPGWELEGGFSFDNSRNNVLYVFRNPKDNNSIAECTASCPILAVSVGNYNLYLENAQSGADLGEPIQSYTTVFHYLLRHMVTKAEAI
ncbi:MAG: hypothetical protein LBJ12_09765 [Oscillospiraceae bacterium]|jgi:hypothetical protein|nr:hypothetical protein [Oscillospiraceae bacterium]